VRPSNNMAQYISGSGSSTLIFGYSVAAGDMSSHLEYASAYALQPGDCTITGANITLPAPGKPASYYWGVGTSLGVNKRISINTMPPRVRNVLSPNADSSYGTGEVVVVQVVFDQPVIVDTSAGSPTLLLETGVFDHEAVLVTVSGNTLTFKYTVVIGDASADLDCQSTAALLANGAVIYRKTTVPTTAAELTLPAPGAQGSLSFNKDITVRPTTVNALDVDSTTVDGTYGAGEVMQISVTFGWWEDEEVAVQLRGGTGAGVGLQLSTGVAVVGNVFAANYVPADSVSLAGSLLLFCGRHTLLSEGYESLSR
jgi:hypothetical protein